MRTKRLIFLLLILDLAVIPSCVSKPQLLPLESTSTVSKADAFAANCGPKILLEICKIYNISVTEEELTNFSESKGGISFFFGYYNPNAYLDSGRFQHYYHQTFHFGCLEQAIGIDTMVPRTGQSGWYEQNGVWYYSLGITDIYGIKGTDTFILNKQPSLDDKLSHTGLNSGVIFIRNKTILRVCSSV